MRLQGVCRAVVCTFLVTVAAACADDDTENGMAPAGGAGGSDAGAGGSSSGAGGMGGSGGTPAGDASSGMDAPSLEGTLCGKYGGPENVMTVMRENVLGEIA